MEQDINGTGHLISFFTFTRAISLLRSISDGFAPEGAEFSKVDGSDVLNKMLRLHHDSKKSLSSERNEGVE